MSADEHDQLGPRRLAILSAAEPATRVLNAVAELQRASGPEYHTIALFPERDRRAWYVRAADEAVCYGSDPLDLEALERALLDCRATQVWVGWGAAAEQVGFVALCERLGVTFVGPSAAALRRVVDRISAKHLAESAGVDVVPWSGAVVESAADADVSAARLGYPLLVKAAAGGGRQRILIVDRPADLAKAVEEAAADATRNFGDSRVYLEAWVPRARQVEVQFIADSAGHLWMPGIRDCTVQRGHRKMLEESSSPALTSEQEAMLRGATQRIVAATGCVNAGTVEFFCDPDDPAAPPRMVKVNPRLQAAHAVTELTSGIDLVKLQLHVAAGGLLEGTAPEPTGHAVEVRLHAESEIDDFAPAPPVIDYLRLPSGPGIRVDVGVTEGDEVPPAADSLIAKIVAWAPDRSEALARLSRAVNQASIVVRGAATNKAFLQSLVDHPDVRAGRVDTGWLDDALAHGDFAPERLADVALLAAATEAYEQDADTIRERFLTSASRGRPELDAEVGHRIQLRHRGVSYDLHVSKVADEHYRVRVEGTTVDLTVRSVSRYERRVTRGGHRHRVLTVTEGLRYFVEVDGVSHSLARDDGGIIRAPAPGVVVSVRVRPGDEVAEGDTVVVIEMMKMELAVPAPFAGRVREVQAVINVQVDARATLLQLDRTADAGPAADPGSRLDFAAPAAPAAFDESLDGIYDGLGAFALGYDLEPRDANRLLAAQGALAGEAVHAGEEELRRRENEFIDLFTDMCALSQRVAGAASDFGGGIVPDASTAGVEQAHSPQQYLYTYLRSPGRAADTVPAWFAKRLQSALARYGIHSLAWPSTPMEHALVRLFRATLRVDALVPAVTQILDRRVDQHAWLPAQETEFARERSRLNDLVLAAQSRYPGIGDLGHEIRFRRFDSPLLDNVLARWRGEAEQALSLLREDPDRADRSALIDGLVASPQPLRPLLLDWYRRSDARMQGVLLETATRRYYRVRELESLQILGDSGAVCCAAEFDDPSGRVHLGVAFGALDTLADLVDSVCGRLDAVAVDAISSPTARGILDFHLWTDLPLRTIDEVEAALRQRLTAAGWGRPRDRSALLSRLDLTVAVPGQLERGAQTYFVSYLCTDEGLVEDRRHRNMHPMLAERLDLGRLDEFEIERLDSVEDVYLFRGVARSNSRDERLFVVAEIRDVTPALDETGRVVGLPHMERMFGQALSAMRRYQAHRTPAKRLLHNEVLLYVRPDWLLRGAIWRDLARRYAPAASALGVSEVVIRVHIPGPSGVASASDLRMSTQPAGGVLMRITPAADRPIPPLSEYEWRVLQTQRRGAYYPYEIIKMLTPPADATSDFPPGDFVEYDLDDSDDGGRLVPVERPYGENAANLVVGVLRNFPASHPEGLVRVALLGDPSRSLGAVAEPECRRINAALDLAEQMKVPVEWFTVSSGARISMSSGTENMDWISATLRRIIEFTQAGGEMNVVVTGINVGAQPYWNSEATMLMHTKGILIMLPESTMVLTGKTSLDFSGGISAEDNLGIGGYERVMGPNGQGQYYARNLRDACGLLLRHYGFTYVLPGERFPRRLPTSDPATRDVRDSPHTPIDGTSFATVGEIFSSEHNADRKKPFDIRSVMRAASDADTQPLERWSRWRNAETVVVWDARIGGFPVCLLGIESRPLRREGFIPADGPQTFTAGTLFPQSSRKAARAVNAASGNRPLVVLANLSGFDGSPESMRGWQLEYGAEIGRAVTNFKGPIVFVVISRYHGGAFVVFSKTLNDAVEVAAVEGSYASVIGGAPAAAVVFARDVNTRAQTDPRVVEAADQLASASEAERRKLQAHLRDLTIAARAEKIGEVAAEFEAIHDIERAQKMGSVDAIIAAQELRPYLVEALERGVARELQRSSDERASHPVV
jgi:acetyl/propionyl-CoA carboxylase alpha subunit/acetyl-CoA carboxylase carboxyltransferase component